MALQGRHNGAPQRFGHAAPHWGSALRLVAAVLVLLATTAPPAQAASRLASFLANTSLTEVFPGAERAGPVEGTPPAAPVFRGGELAGYVLLNSDVVSSVGYSGKPIDVLVGIDLDGRITGAKLVKHSEPIVLIGIPESRVTDFIAAYVGKNVIGLAGRPTSGPREVDIVSGATVTVLVIEDSMLRAALKVARARGLGGLTPTAEARPRERVSVDMTKTAAVDWPTLVGDGSVRRLALTVGEVTEAFQAAGHAKAAGRPESKNPADVFIDLYAAVATIPSIGRSLLGQAEYDLLTARLKPGEQAIVIAGNGKYSFKGSGYVRGGIFDRISLVQGDNAIRFRDKQHKRLGDLMAAKAPRFREIALFVIPADVGFDPAQPWRLELLAQRAVSALKKAFVSFDLAYMPPEKYLVREPVPAPTQPQAAAPPAAPAQFDEDGGAPLWLRIWRERLVDVGILVTAIAILTGVFFFQNLIVVRRELTEWLRLGFLLFTLFWIGWYANAQLSVVNVLTFSNALITDFRWEYFLMDPLVFILWVSVAASMLYWGRGAYCGWLCPFGALQEVLNKVATVLRVPQLHVPWGLHERLWPIKYMLFLGLFGLSFYSLALAEQASEVEPFKTSIILGFSREWPFVAYAVLLLGIGLFIERFFCRYLCPLGAALAIPGRLRMFEWLRRHKQCGSPCQICAHECMVQAIHPDGHINPNECLYCLHCQQVYWDDHVCPAMIQRRLKRERRRALQSKPLAEVGRSREKVLADR
ncbi:MAG: 4Fe-4S binding protein [Alphaproteobacteria bacterium]|nr:4Fe-4S binding protein [Alphaproteobacteria bacterium]